VVDGRAELADEIANASDVRLYIAEQFRSMLGTSQFVDALPGYLLPDLSSQSRLTILLERLKRFSES
jgi:hypothetical protein